MYVKLKDKISLKEFFKISFGSDDSTYYSYAEYFSLENLRKSTTAREEGKRLIVDIIQADGDTFTDYYETTEEKDMWEELK